jgi:hypothetical protein
VLHDPCPNFLDSDAGNHWLVDESPWELWESLMDHIDPLTVVRLIVQLDIVHLVVSLNLLALFIVCIYYMITAARCQYLAAGPIGVLADQSCDP